MALWPSTSSLLPLRSALITATPVISVTSAPKPAPCPGPSPSQSSLILDSVDAMGDKKKGNIIIPSSSTLFGKKMPKNVFEEFKTKDASLEDQKVEIHYDVGTDNLMYACKIKIMPDQEPLRDDNSKMEINDEELAQDIDQTPTPTSFSSTQKKTIGLFKDHQKK